MCAVFYVIDTLPLGNRSGREARIPSTSPVLFPRLKPLPHQTFSVSDPVSLLSKEIELFLWVLPQSLPPESTPSFQFRKPFCLPLFQCITSCSGTLYHRFYCLSEERNCLRISCLENKGLKKTHNPLPHIHLTV